MILVTTNIIFTKIIYGPLHFNVLFPLERGFQGGGYLFK